MLSNESDLARLEVALPKTTYEYKGITDKQIVSSDNHQMLIYKMLDTFDKLI